jgi:tetratricopeptide (TPR) repeat protein
MMRGRWRSIFLYTSLILGFIGGGVFISALLIELSSHDQSLGVISPSVQIALAGLCLAVGMFAIWFVLVGSLLVRQSRQQGSGYGDAYRLIEAFRFREAIPLLERSIKEGKETAEVLMLLTSAYAYAGQLGKAQATADRAVRLFPNDPGSYITLANGYRLQAAYEEAARALMQAAELEPDQPIIWAELGFVQRFAGDFSAALDSFKRAARDVMPAMYGVRVYYHLAQAFQAEDDTKQAVRAIVKMISARDGLAIWQSGLNALEGTAYGHALSREISAIREALADADTGNLG